MKKTLLLIFTICATNFSFAQQRIEPLIEYGKANKLGFYEKYLTKNGDTITVGDSLEIGKASNFNKFVYIYQGNNNMHADHTGKKVKIKSIEVYGKKKSGYSVYLSFKGFGLLPVFVNYEPALEVGEIKLIGAKMTKSEAIEKLKKEKELLDLEIITQEQYNKIKEELTPIITK